jgi:hypothetical protein
MQVRAGGKAGVADESDGFSLVYLLSGFYQKREQMAVA